MAYDPNAGFDIPGLLKRTLAMRTNAAFTGGKSDEQAPAAPQAPASTRGNLVLGVDGSTPTARMDDGTHGPAGIVQSGGAEADASRVAPAAPAPAPNPGLQARSTGVKGIYAVKGPDGSTTYTDVPGGSFEQVSGGGGHPDTARNAAGHLVGEMGTGQGNFSAAGSTAGGGLRYKLPTGDGVVDEGTRQGHMPGTTDWLRANANVQRRDGEAEADFGNRVAASKAAGLNYRSHSGEFADRALNSDPAAIGPEAAYRSGTGAGPGGGGGAGGVNVPGMPPGLGVDALVKLAGLKNANTETALDVGKHEADLQKQAREFDQSKYDEHLKSLADRKDLSPEDKMRIAQARTHNEMVQTYPNVESEAFTNSNKGRQVLADEADARTRANNEKPSRGTADLADFTTRRPGFWTRNTGDPMGLSPFGAPKHPVELVRGLRYKDDGKGGIQAVPADNASTSAGTRFTRQTPIGRELFGENGEKAGDFDPAFSYAQRRRAAGLARKRQGQ